MLLFVAIMLWIYRLVLRGWINVFSNSIPFQIGRDWYESQLRRALSGKTPYFLIFGTFTLLFLAFASFGWSLGTQRTKVEFFPDNKPNQIIVYIEYPEGTDIEKTNRITEDIEKRVFSILNDELYMDGTYNFMVESAVSQVGEGAGNPQTDIGTTEMPHKRKNYSFHEGI